MLKKILWQVFSILGIMLAVMLAASKVDFSAWGVNLKSGSVYSIGTALAIFLTALFFIKDNKVKVLRVWRLAGVIAGIGALILIATLFEIPNAIFIVIGTIVATILAVQLIALAIEKLEPKIIKRREAKQNNQA